jgi:hypothetical protein
VFSRDESTTQQICSGSCALLRCGEKLAQGAGYAVQGVGLIAANRRAQGVRWASKTNRTQRLVERHAFEVDGRDTRPVVSSNDQVDAGSTTPRLLAHLRQTREAVNQRIKRRAEDDLPTVALPGREADRNNHRVDERTRLVREAQNYHAGIVRQCMSKGERERSLLLVKGRSRA